MTDEITALHSHHTPLTKSIGLNPDGSFRRVSFGNVRLFDVGSIRVRQIYDIFGVLDAQQESTHSAIIRGQLIDEENRRNVRRLLYPRDGDPATDVPRRYDVEFTPSSALLGVLPAIVTTVNAVNRL